jgi:hypothetical protein
MISCTLFRLTLRLAIIAVLSFLAPPVRNVCGDTAVRTIALSGASAPGAEGSFFRRFLEPRINNLGQVAFRADQIGPGVDPPNDGVYPNGIWHGDKSGLQLIARADDVAPGTDGAVFQYLRDPVLNNSGQLLFYGSLDTQRGGPVTGRNDTGIWSYGISGGLSLVVREDDPAPGLGGIRFGAFPDAAMNDAGRIAFSISLKNDLFGDSLWVAENGQLRLLMQRNDGAPSTGGATFYGAGSPNVGPRGDISFVGWLDSPGNDFFVKSAIWIAGPEGDLSPVAIEDQFAPGTDYATFWELPTYYLGRPTGMGHVAFIAELSESGAPEPNRGLWSTRGDDGLELVVRQGDPVPGTEGAAFAALSRLRSNDAGQIAFGATLEGADVDRDNDHGIWVERRGSELETVARKGDVAPGTSGARYRTVLGSAVSGGTFEMNNRGQIAFDATIYGEEVTERDDLGIWATDPQGALRLIVRKGDVLDVDDGPEEDLRTIAALDFASFNDLGQLPFAATFSDGSSGIFVSDLVATTLRGDLNGNGRVDQADLDLVLRNWGASFDELPAEWIEQHYSIGIVDQAELDNVLVNWGAMTARLAGAAVVPEPSALLLVTLLLVWSSTTALVLPPGFRAAA